MYKETLWDKKWQEDFKDTFGATSLDRCSRRCFEIVKEWIGPNPGSILEAGSGTGRFCIALAKEYINCKITALDVSRAALKLVEEGARKRRLKNILFVKTDIYNMPFDDNSFDIVFNEGVIEHFENYEAILREMIRVAKPGGKVIVAVPNWYNLVYNLTLFFSKKERREYGRIKLFKHEELNNLLKRCGLIDIKISGFDPAHAITRLSKYWPKYEWLGRKIDSFVLRPLDAVTRGGFSSRFGFEVITCGTKVNKEALDCRISRAWSERSKSKYHYVNFQFLAAEKELMLYRRFVNLRKRNILDVGCGLGGKIVRYAQEASEAFAVDYRFDDVKFAKKFSDSRKKPVRFAQADISHLPFKKNRFNVMILNDIIEHLPEPKDALMECKRVLEDGGIIFLNFPPFYGPGGGHLGYYFSASWIHLLPKGLINYLLLRKRPKEGWITPERVLDVFNSTNRMTIRRFRKIVNYSQLKVKHFQIEAYESRLLRRFIDWPFFDELLAKNVRFVLEKK